VLVREGIITTTNNLFAMHKGLGSCKALYHNVYMQLCGMSFICGLHSRAEKKRKKDREGGRERDREKRENVLSRQ
jgi:hypothetical protein